MKYDLILLTQNYIPFKLPSYSLSVGKLCLFRILVTAEPTLKRFTLYRLFFCGSVEKVPMKEEAIWAH